MTFKPTHTTKFIKNNHLSELIKKAAEQDKIFLVTKNVLSPEIANKISGAVVKNKILIILVESQIWSTRLRYLAPNLKDNINQYLTEKIYAVQIKVSNKSPVPKRSTPAKRKRPPLPGDVLFQAAIALDDPELSDVLARMASKFGKKKHS